MAVDRPQWQCDILDDLIEQHGSLIEIPVSAYPLWWLRDTMVSARSAIRSFGRHLVNGRTGDRDWYVKSLADNVELLRRCEAELEHRQRAITAV